MTAQLHPNDSELFSGGQGAPSDPTPLVKGDQDRNTDADTVIAQGIAIVLVVLAFAASGIVLWLHQTAGTL